MKKKKKITTGGVALSDGIVFTSEYRQAIIEDDGKKFYGRTISLSKDKNILKHIPIIRGIVGVGSQLFDASDKFSSSISDGTSINGYITILIYIVLIAIFIGIPVALSAAFSEDYRAFIQAILIAFEFVVYTLFVNSFNTMDNTFAYHGAEHKAVNAYDKYNNIEELTLENIKKCSRIHKRCGGNLVVYVVILMMLSTLFPITNLLYKYIAMLGFGIFSVGLAYEIIYVFSKLPKPLDIINYPACIVQLVTTKEPTDKMLELARLGVIASVREENMTINEFVNEYKNGKEIEDINDIYLILESVTRIDLNTIILNKQTQTISFSEMLRAKEMLDRYYYENYPLQYLTHKQYFFNEEYYVDENVLIPRADTEILVEKAIEYINNEDENINKIIDLCCGSGAIGISIAKNVEKDIDVELIDVSTGALSVSNRNIDKNRVQDKVHILNSDLLAKKIEQININEEFKVDMIVSNPPYIKSKDMETLDENVKKEPHIALDGGQDGMVFYNRIIKEAKSVLRDGGLLLFEIGYDELEQMKELIKNNSEYTMLESLKDYNGNDRVVICRFQQKLEEKS